jgi:hypothetical protein
VRAVHQQKYRALLGASFLSMISPAKYGRLGASRVHEVATQLMKVHFWALSALTLTRTLKVIEVFPFLAHRSFGS